MYFPLGIQEVSVPKTILPKVGFHRVIKNLLLSHQKGTFLKMGKQSREVSIMDIAINNKSIFHFQCVYVVCMCV